MPTVPTIRLAQLLHDVRACRVCEASLPLGPRPVVQLGARAKIVIIGQAPGTKVHASGVPWDDASGDHLRSWLGLDRDTFYDRQRVAIVPMGFCYPGKKGDGDAPPRPECAPLWHAPLLSKLPRNALRLLVGQYAQKQYLGRRRKKTLTATVEAFESYLPADFVLPHPSWRSKRWMTKNPWFEARVLPVLQAAVAART
ncbi:MAG: uracil-DNA glycosylase family protein [Sandaracinaceae bacterium]